MDYPSRKVDNPWSDILKTPDNLIGAQGLLMALQWGAPSNKLTPEANELLDQLFQWRAEQKNTTP